jgi:hypothetical protein
MFVLNDDLSIYVTRGDIVFFGVTAEDNGVPYTFKAGDVLRIKVYGKKDADTIALQKDFPVTEDAETVEIFLDEEDTKIGGIISKPVDYWYEVELNPFNNPQTIIGYDEDGAKIFKLFPESADVEEYEPSEEDIPVVDTELDMISTRPVQNQAIARAIVQLKAAFDYTAKQSDTTASALDVERARIDSLVAGDTADGAEVVDIRVGANGTTYASAGAAVRGQVNILSDNIKSSFFEIGYASKYISACKVFTDEYEYLMLSDIRRGYERETGFRIYSCDETGKDFAYVSTVSLEDGFEKGYVEHSFGQNSLLKCYVDLTSMEYGKRQSGDGKPFVLKRECFLPTGSIINAATLKNVLFASCNTDPRKILTWVDDDTPLDGIATAKKICDDLGIKCTFATITNGWTDTLLDRLHQYHKEGFHIACHTESHGRWYKDMPDGNIFDAKEMETDLIVSLEKMRAEGFLDSDMLVYPGSASGRSDVDTIGIVKKWCRCGVLAGGNTWSKHGQGKYKINRTFISKSANDVSYYKGLLNSVSDEAWVVFGTHSGSATDFDATMVREILSHALANGWTIMPLNEALKYREKYYHIQEMLGL